MRSFTFAILLGVMIPGLPIPGHAIETVFARYQDRVDRSVDRGLNYLADSFDLRNGFGGEHGEVTGVVALAGMAFLSRGHLPGEGPHGGTINGCIDYVISRQQSDGLLIQSTLPNAVMYAHGISTLFLSEVSGMVDPERQRRLDVALSKALRVLLDAQAIPKSRRNRGGWRYRPDSTDSDLSCSGWSLMALRSARANGAPVPDEALEAAADYVARCRDEESGGFGYTDTTPRETLAGCGVLCLVLSGWPLDAKLEKAGDYILETTAILPSKDHQHYANYYNAQAMFQLGGRFWEDYAAWMYENYLPQQTPDGSWMHRKYGKAYATSMVILGLAVPYRQLPIYQRDEVVTQAREIKNDSATALEGAPK